MKLNEKNTIFTSSLCVLREFHLIIVYTDTFLSLQTMYFLIHQMNQILQ